MNDDYDRWVKARPAFWSLLVVAVFLFWLTGIGP